MKKIFVFVLLLQTSLGFTQNLGIGTANPFRGKLEVWGGNNYTAAIFGGESSGISVQHTYPGLGFNHYATANGSKFIGNGYAALQQVEQTTGAMVFDFYGTGSANSFCGTSNRVLKLEQNGNVTIGNVSNNATLAVARNTGVDATVAFFGGVHNSFFNYGPSEHTYIRAGLNNGTVFINDIPGSKISIIGRVGINTGTPDNGLEVRQSSGYGMVLVESTSFANWEFVVLSNGNQGLRYNGVLKGQFSASNGSYSSTSDRRLKTNIQPLGASLDKVMQLQPVEYQMKADETNAKTIGFIAQEVKEVFPQLVTVSNGNEKYGGEIQDLHSLNYSEFGVLAVKAVQEQQALINAQSQRIDTLEKKAEAIEQRIKARK